MFHAEPRSLLNDMAVLRRDIISLRSILRPQMSVVGALIHGNWPFIHEDLDAYWGDINDHLLQLCSLLEEYSEFILLPDKHRSSTDRLVVMVLA